MHGDIMEEKPLTDNEILEIITQHKNSERVSTLTMCRILEKLFDSETDEDIKLVFSTDINERKRILDNKLKREIRDKLWVKAWVISIFGMVLVISGSYILAIIQTYLNYYISPVEVSKISKFIFILILLLPLYTTAIYIILLSSKRDELY